MNAAHTDPILKSLGFSQIQDIYRLNVLYICQTRVKCAEYSLQNVTPKILNETPQIIKDKIWTHSLHCFVWYIKCYFINVCNTECTVAYCYICALQR